MLRSIGCSTDTSLQGEDAAAAGRDAALALVQLEAKDEGRRIKEGRKKVLRLWKGKEGEVESLKDELEMEREVRSGGAKRRKTGREGFVVRPDTPPEQGGISEFLKPSSAGEVRDGGF